MSCLNASHLCVIFISLCLPLANACTHLLTHSLTHSLTQLTHSLTHSLTLSLTHSLTLSLTLSRHSLTHSLTDHSLSHSLTHSPTHSLIHPLTHTHSLYRWQARKAFTAKFLSSKLPQVTAYRQVSTSIIHSHIDTVLVKCIV